MCISTMDNAKAENAQATRRRQTLPLLQKVAQDVAEALDGQPDTCPRAESF